MSLLGHGEHAAGTASAVVEQIRAGLYFIGDGQEGEFCHERHGITRGPVFSGLLVVFLVEAANQFFEDSTHAVVIEAGVPDGAVGVHHRSRGLS